MKTLGIEKRSAVLYVRVKPSLLAFIKAEAKQYEVQPSRVIEAMIEARIDNCKKPKRKKRA